MNKSMGYYIQFISKELKLRSDIPKDLIYFLHDCINRDKFEIKFEHGLFLLERWQNLFMASGHLKEKTYFRGNDKLRIACVINYGRQEILEFARWITPYVAGHKPKEYIGELIGEERTDRDNVYLNRSILLLKEPFSINGV